jgi:hypothetical protein
MTEYTSTYCTLMKLEFCRQIFEKYSNIKFNENPSSGSRVVPCGRTDMKLIHIELPMTECFKITTKTKHVLIPNSTSDNGARDGVVVKARRYKPAGRGFDSRWCHWNFSVT